MAESYLCVGLTPFSPAVFFVWPASRVPDRIHLRSGNLFLNAATKTSSALCENNPTGEQPRRRARSSESRINVMVRTMFGQAFKDHWPDQVHPAFRLNGMKYGMGH